MSSPLRYCPKAIVSYQQYADADESVEVTYIVTFGTPERSNLENSEYHQSLICPNCRAKLVVCIN